MHIRRWTTTLGLLLTVPVLACGGGERGGGNASAGQEAPAAGASEGAAAGQQQAARELTMPDWMQVDRSARTATLEIVAGKTDANNSWNFNGYADGEVEVVVPVDFEITVDFRNADQVMAHSLGIDELQESWPATFQNPRPVFQGAITSSPTTMDGATQPGQSEIIVFTADSAGEYAMVCYIPAHASQGMWIYFTVSPDGEAGMRKRQG